MKQGNDEARSLYMRVKLIIQQLCKLAFFKIKPEEIPYATTAFMIVIFANIIIYCYSMINLFGFFIGAILGGTFVALLMIYLILLLKTYHLQSRFIQTSIGLLGCNAMITLLGLLLNYFIMMILNQQVAVNLWMNLSKVIMMTLFVWSLAVCAYIFKYALNCHWLVASINAIAMLVFANAGTWLLLLVFMRHAPIVQ
jgi:hypothetical protein